MVMVRLTPEAAIIGTVNEMLTQGEPCKTNKMGGEPRG